MAPVWSAATRAAFNVGVTTTSRCPSRSSNSRVAANVVVFSRPRGALDERQRTGPSQRSCHHLLGAIQLAGCFDPTDHVLGGTGLRVGGAGDQPGRELALNGQDLRRGKRPEVFGHPASRSVAVDQQRDANHQRPGGEVLGQLKAHGRGRDQPGARDQLLDLTANIGGVPGRPARAHRDSTVCTAPGRSSAPTLGPAFATIAEAVEPICGSA